MADLQLLEELGDLVADLTTSGNSSLNSNLMKKVKGLCKKSDVYVRHVYHLVMTQLKKHHAEIRLSSFQIINELFVRSHSFREMLLVDFIIFLELTVETDPKQPLPPPRSTAKILKDKALEAIEAWFGTFGTHYKKLDLGYSYLKKVKKVDFNTLSARTRAERQQSEEKERRRKNFIKGKIIRVENEMSEMMGDMELCVTEMENCFKLLLPHPNEYEFNCEEENKGCSSKFKNDYEGSSAKSQDLGESSEHQGLPHQAVNIPVEVLQDSGTNNDEMSQVSESEQVMTDQDIKGNNSQQLLSNHGFATRSYEISIDLNICGPDIKETADNSIVLHTVKEMNKELTHKHLPMINNWLSVLSKGDNMQSKIQQLIDLKRLLEAAKSKFLELKIRPMGSSDGGNWSELKQSTSHSDLGSVDEDEDDDTEDFEDVPEKEGLELLIPPNKRAEYGLDPLPTVNQSETVKSSHQKLVGEDTELLQQFGGDLRELGDPSSRTTALFHLRNKLSDDKKSLDMANNAKIVTDDKKRELLQKAPVVPYDMDLYFWEDPTAQVPKMIKTYLDNHWGSKEYEGEYILGNEREAKPTRLVTFAGKFEPVKWSCRATLPSGKLCPRQDRVKCPFHGKIIPRDEMGTPVNYSNSPDVGTVSVSEDLNGGTLQDVSDSSADWKEIQLEIEAATGVDLGGKKKDKQKGSSAKSGKRKADPAERPGLTDLKKKRNTPRNRLQKVVLNKTAMRRVADEMDAIATRRCQNKFGNQFNYAITK